jgi:hypothetical protein
MPDVRVTLGLQFSYASLLVLAVYTLHSFHFVVTVFLVIKSRAFDTVRALLDTAAIKPCIQAPVSIKFPRI